MQDSFTVTECCSSDAAPAASPREVDSPFLIDRPGIAWLVQSGHVDLFLVELRNGEPAGFRSHVLRTVEGELVCGMGGSSNSMAILARPSPETSLKEVTQQSLLATVEGVQKLEVWLDRLGEAFSATLPPKQHERLEPWQQVRIEEEAKAAAPVADVAWVRVLKGSARLIGEPSLPVLRNAGDGGACFPVPRKAWLLAGPGTVLDVVDRIAARETDPFGEGLAEFHDHALCALVLAHGQAEAREQQRLRAKAASASAALERSLHALGTPVNGNAEAPHAPKAVAPVFRACELAIADLGMTVETPSRIPAEPRSGVVAVAGSAGLRVREILLRENWWYDYSGPMVAFRKEDGLPVALIRGGSTGYRIHQPSERKPVKVTGANAGELTGVAYLFYRPFPMRRLTFRDLLVFGLTGSRRELGFMVLMGIAAGILGLAAPLAFGALFDHVIPNAERGQVALLGALLALAAVCTTLFNLAGGFATLRIETRIASSLQTALWDRLLNLPVSFFRSYTTGDLASRSTAIDRMRQTLTGPVIISGMAAILSSFQLAVLFIYSARMAFIAVGLLTTAFAVATVLGVFQARSQRKITSMQGRISGILSELLGGISKIRVAGAEMRAFAYWAERFSVRSREWVRSRCLANALTIFNSAFPAASLALVYWAGLHFMQADGVARMKTGEFLAFTATFQMLLFSVLQVSSAVVAGLVIVPEYERLRPILETPPESGPGKSDPPELVGDIEVSRVTFRYRPDQPPVLRDLSLQVKAGEFVAIVGESGCGKSTLLRILLGFEQPESGAVYYDKQALKGLNLGGVRRQIGVVLQSGRLLAGSILSNIVRSLPLSPNEVLEAARLAGLEDDINELPMGLHTVLSDGGGGLSGGQRQRVLIARAIVNRPRILLFDEATSALDNRSQALISERLGQLKATRIVIAHRLSTIRNADRILVMQNGGFIQSGTYDQLIHEPGLFAELAARQTLR